jgi:ankyrin repeat protein
MPDNRRYDSRQSLNSAAAGDAAAAQAVGFGDTATVRALLDDGASANERDQNGDTLLNFAVYPNRVDVAQLLLERGADVNHVDSRGMTALLYAASAD